MRATEGQLIGTGLLMGWATAFLIDGALNAHDTRLSVLLTALTGVAVVAIVWLAFSPRHPHRQ